MKYKQGDLVVAKVVSIKPYGAFLKLEDNQVGLLHISELSHDFVSDINDHVKVGDALKVKILKYDPKTKQMIFSLKALQPPKNKARKLIKHKKNSSDLTSIYGATLLLEKIDLWIKNYKE
ncbi:MAG: S1 RNA-binding domain-containing protein [Bacilli bacterium]